jgi:hypothetical protein
MLRVIQLTLAFYSNKIVTSEDESAKFKHLYRNAITDTENRKSNSARLVLSTFRPLLPYSDTILL